MSSIPHASSSFFHIYYTKKLKENKKRYKYHSRAPYFNTEKKSGVFYVYLCISALQKNTRSPPLLIDSLTMSD